MPPLAFRAVPPAVEFRDAIQVPRVSHILFGAFAEIVGFCTGPVVLGQSAFAECRRSICANQSRPGHSECTTVFASTVFMHYLTFFSLLVHCPGHWAAAGCLHGRSRNGNCSNAIPAVTHLTTQLIIPGYRPARVVHAQLPDAGNRAVGRDKPRGRHLRTRAHRMPACA